MTNTLRIMLEILNNYPWTRLSVRITGVIERQFFPDGNACFDNSNLSQEIFGINTWGAVICSLGHGRKHMLKPPGLSLVSIKPIGSLSKLTRRPRGGSHIQISIQLQSE